MVYQLLFEKQSSHCTLLPAVFNQLPTSTNRKVFENQLCNQSSQLENFLLSSCATTELTLFRVSKDEWNTMEGTG